MDNPWEIKQDDSRESDLITNFIIICEDSISEPVYFKYFETNKIKVNCIKNQKSMMKNVVNAIDYCQKRGLILNKDGQSIVAEGTQIWCVFDRDQGTGQDTIDKENIEFDLSINSASDKGIKVAWSNDSFELWVLLHFQDVDSSDSHRQTYYDKLTEIFRTLPTPSEDLKKILAHNSYNYKRDFKSEKNFRNIVRKEITSKTEEAILRAQNLHNSYDTSAPHSKKSPLTLVYKLVEELLKHGEQSKMV